MVKLSSSHLQHVSEKLTALRDFIPSEFARRPRSLLELDRWKATEYRQFLLYTGPVVLKSVLTTDLYKHFLCLSVSIGIMLMSDRDRREHYLDYACELMRHFVSNCERLYGTEFVMYNIHSLLHLGDDVKHFEASLDEISSFPFENFLQTLKRLIRSPSNPISQVVKRMHEFEYVRSPPTSTSATPKQCKFSPNSRDSVVLLKNGKFAEIIVGRHYGAEMTRSQFPLTLASGCTIHKVQGITVDHIVMCMNGPFNPGQAYVALSRARNIKGLYLTDFNALKIITSDKVKKEMARLQQKSKGTVLEHNTEDETDVCSSSGRRIRVLRVKAAQGPYSRCLYQIWCKSVQKWRSYGSLTDFKMGAAAILDFCTM